MPYYSVFGSCLRSEITFPELRTIPDALPRWTLHVSDGRPTPGPAEWLGKDDVGDGTDVRLSRLAAGYRLEYDDNTGAFEVSADGRDIVWFPVANPDEEMARLHVIGRVLATALHAAGMFCLHGSGVALNGGAIGFLAQRFCGKSTLAMALTKAGAQLLSDDTLTVHPDDSRLRLWPGVHSVRLWGDSAQRVAGDDPAGGAPPFEVKRTYSDLPQRYLAEEPVPLRAVYLLAPTKGAPDAPPVSRTLLPPIPSAASLVGHAKIGALLGKSEAPVLFDRAVRVAGRLRVYRLDVARDFDRIPEVVAQLTEWHQDGAATSPLESFAR